MPADPGPVATRKERPPQYKVVRKPGKGPRVDRPDGPTVPQPDQPEPDGDEELEVVEIPHVPGDIEKATIQYVASFQFADGDQRRLLGLICIRLARRIDETGALAAAVKELRAMLFQIAEIPNEKPGQVDEARLRRQANQLGDLLGAML